MVTLSQTDKVHTRDISTSNTGSKRIEVLTAGRITAVAEATAVQKRVM